MSSSSNLENINSETESKDDTIERTNEETLLASLGTKKKPTRTPSSAWQHFKKIFDSNNNHFQTKCNYCRQIYSAKCSTTTLNDHLKSKHSDIQSESIGSIEKAKSQDGENLNHLDRLINWVILEYQPFKMVDSNSFRELINGLNPGFKVPSRQTLRGKIDNKYSYYKNKIIKMFQVKTL